MSWVQSSRCNGGGCVQVRRSGDRVFVRSTLKPGLIELTVEELQAFVAGVKLGEFDGLATNTDDWTHTASLVS